MGDYLTVVNLLVWAIIWGGIGAMLGEALKGNAIGGAWRCAILGPIGVLFTLAMHDDRIKCSECKGRIPVDARKCRHCGSDVTPFAIQPQAVRRPKGYHGLATQVHQAPAPINTNKPPASQQDIDGWLQQ